MNAWNNYTIECSRSEKVFGEIGQFLLHYCRRRFRWRRDSW